MRWILLIPILTLAAAPVGSVDMLTLDAAVGAALQNNQMVQGTQAELEASQARSRQAKGMRLPSIELMETYNGTNNPAEAFALQLNQKRFDMMEFFQSDPNNPDWLSTWISRLEVTQPVYTGGKLGARISQADLMAEGARLTHDHTRELVAHETTMAFTNLAKAREHLALLEKARRTTAEHVRLAELYAGQGFILEADVLRAQVYLAEVDEMVEQAANGARLAEAALNFVMGSDQGTQLTLGPLPPLTEVSGDLESWIDAGGDRRRDLAAARRQLEAGQLEEKVARAPFLPEVAMIGRFDLYDDSPLGTHGDSGTVMAVAKINLFRGGADRAGLEAARHDTRSFAHQVERFEAGVSLEIRQAWHAAESARSRLATSRTSLEAAREALRVREERFRQGLDKMIDLLDAETALREAEVRELVARYDLTMATFRLNFVSGASVIDLVHASEETS